MRTGNVSQTLPRSNVILCHPDNDKNYCDIPYGLSFYMSTKQPVARLDISKSISFIFLDGSGVTNSTYFRRQLFHHLRTMIFLSLGRDQLIVGSGGRVRRKFKDVC
jgi:hypothetical protein